VTKPPTPRPSRRKPRLSDAHAAAIIQPPTPRETAARRNLAATASYGYVRINGAPAEDDQLLLCVQRRQLEGWATQRGHPLDEVIVEAGLSGVIPFQERPEGSKLWNGLQKGDTLVAAKLDRMFRSASDCLAVVEAFKARGVSLFLLDLNGGSDDVSGNGIARLFLTIVSAFAEFERDRIGERIRATKRAQRARGEYLGGKPPFGWVYNKGLGDKDRQLVPVPEQQKALCRIRTLHGKGLSPYKISDDLAERGVKLSHVTIRKILSGRPTV
jgi:putative DNA-invertase from lambdoid prophage Rac